MKILLITFAWLMLPIAFVVVAFDIAKASVEDKLESKLRRKR